MNSPNVPLASYLKQGVDEALRNKNDVKHITRPNVRQTTVPRAVAELAGEAVKVFLTSSIQRKSSAVEIECTVTAKEGVRELALTTQDDGDMLPPGSLTRRGTALTLLKEKVARSGGRLLIDPSKRNLRQLYISF